MAIEDDFAEARAAITDEGAFSPDQIALLRNMLDNLETAVLKAANSGPVSARGIPLD